MYKNVMTKQVWRSTDSDSRQDSCGSVFEQIENKGQTE